MNKILMIILVFITALTACKKSSYYEDTGTTNPRFNGSTLEYLQSKPIYFDSIVKIAKICGFDQALAKQEVTFFAPADSSVRLLFKNVNIELGKIGKPYITKLSDVSPAVWKKYLSRYIFKFKKGLVDFPQIDFNNLTSFSGQIYPSYEGADMNIGAVYDDIAVAGVNIKYAGYRHLTISYLTSPFTPKEYKSWITAHVASVNIVTNNGYVHVLKYPNHPFGFDQKQFAEEVAFKN